MLASLCSASIMANLPHANSRAASLPVSDYGFINCSHILSNRLPTGLFLAIVLSFLVASLANDWRRWRLTTIGYQLVAITVASNLHHAEEKFFHSNWPNTNSVNDREVKTKKPMPASTLTPFATPFDSE